jgi:hypothetical protein
MAIRRDQPIGGRKGPFSDHGSRHGGGGVKVQLSSCCNAPVVYSKGGVGVLICQKCRNPIRQKIIG